MNAEGVEPGVAAAVATMFAADSASQSLGMRVEAAAAGAATVTMTVTADMVNGLEVCHGGLLFTLADSAMAFASNAAARSLATNAEIDFVRAARLGDELTAVATMTVTRGKTAIHDVTVRNQLDEVVAVFRGRTLVVAPPRSTPPSSASGGAAASGGAGVG